MAKAVAKCEILLHPRTPRAALQGILALGLTPQQLLSLVQYVETGDTGRQQGDNPADNALGKTYVTIPF